jgi:sugar porter (SP) family MFS transporter
MRPQLLGIVIIAALGGFLFGFDTAVISGTTDALKEVYSLSSGELGFSVASALIGTIIGALLAGWPADRIGRRATLLWIAALYFVSAVGTAFAWDWYSFLFFRFIGGLGVGGASGVSPMYIAEISPAAYRGRLVAVQQFNIVLGILAAFFSNYMLAQQEFGGNTWRWMFGVEALPALAFLFLLFLTPRSPRWLVAIGREDEAQRVLARLGTDAPTAQQELAAIREALARERGAAADALFDPAYARPVRLVVAIAIFNQLSGINAILYYAPKIFSEAGAAGDAALWQTVIIGATNLLFTMLAMAVIDRFGRRKLMLAGSIGYIVSLAAAAGVFYVYQGDWAGKGQHVLLAALVVFIAAHAFGQGAVIWVFIGEVFPNRVRARGQALGSFVHWIMAAAISWTFPVFVNIFGAGNTMAFYAAMMVLQLVWVITAMPETKGIPLEEMDRRLEQAAE